jgi:hypothetical protein
MDTFALTTGIAGIALLAGAVAVFARAGTKAVKKKTGVKKFLVASIVALVMCIFSISLIFLSLFIQTFTRYTSEELIGTVSASASGNTIRMRFVDNMKNRTHEFELAGDQWMVEGYILRWSPEMRWLGAGTYYRVSRFRGRWEEPGGKRMTEYVIQPEEKSWKYLLQHGEEMPFVDSAYGIGAFQYPSAKIFYLYISDSGFVLKNH